LALWLQIGARRITPVLGPGLASAILGSRSQMARRWVERWQMPISTHDQGDLAKVAQYLRVRSVLLGDPAAMLRRPANVPG
jgi:hypothetical protein